MGEQDPVPNPLAAEAVAEHMRVLGQPVRVRLLVQLDADGEMTVRALAEAVGVSVHNASQHLAVLRSAGVVRRRHQGRTVLYTLTDRSALEIYAQVGAALVNHARHLDQLLEAQPTPRVSPWARRIAINCG